MTDVMPDANQDLNEQVARLKGWTVYDPEGDYHVGETGNSDPTPLPDWAGNLGTAMDDLWPELREAGWKIGVEPHPPFYWIGNEKQEFYKSTNSVKRFAFCVSTAWVEEMGKILGYSIMDDFTFKQCVDREMEERSQSL